MKAIRHAREFKADLACSLSPARRNATLALASGAKAVAGYFANPDIRLPYMGSTPVEAFGIRLEKAETYGRENIALRAAKVFRALGAAPAGSAARSRADLEVLAARQQEIHSLLPGREWVAIHPLASWEFRQWPMARFASLAGLIVARLNHF